MLKTILITLGAIVLVLLLTALIMKKECVITSEVVINKPQNEVFEFVSHLKNQEQYSKWVMADPNVKLDYRGQDGTVGFVAAWHSEDKNVGVGEQEIKEIIEGKRYEVELRFEKPFKAVNQAYTEVVAVGPEQSKVTTVFQSRNPFPMNLMNPFIKSMLQKDMDYNSNNLKKVLENGEVS
ncbi:SRPBCC family protein [Pararhodonellum marinum]|uniref:SRPBCC family protein n=1 Tax=Pararhodonellum marinum TaxID=2755358 RepID=UPI00188E0298|nr:SRPBCC family protein [Pararhodonellum marinum]